MSTFIIKVVGLYLIWRVATIENALIKDRKGYFWILFKLTVSSVAILFI